MSKLHFDTSFDELFDRADAVGYVLGQCTAGYAVTPREHMLLLPTVADVEAWLLDGRVPPVPRKEGLQW